MDKLIPKNKTIFWSPVRCLNARDFIEANKYMVELGTAPVPYAEVNIPLRRKITAYDVVR